MGQGRRQFTDEFKREAVALLASSGRPLTQIASELGIAPVGDRYIDGVELAGAGDYRAAQIVLGAGAPDALLMPNMA
jgi:transposase